MYGSGYGGYGSSMYGSMGSSMYGGLSSYSTMGSSMYGSGMMMGQNSMTQDGNNNPMQNQQERRFRDEYQGILMGFNSLLNIMGASIGLIGYGGTFLEFTKKAISFVLRGCSNIAYKIFFIKQIKRLLYWLTSSQAQKGLHKSFSMISPQKVSKFAFGKLLYAVQAISALALFALYYMQTKLNQNIKRAELERQKQLEKKLQEEKNKSKDMFRRNNSQLDDSQDQIIDLLNEQFDSTLNKEKRHIRNTQIRSEDFWDHSRIDREEKFKAKNRLSRSTSQSSTRTFYQDAYKDLSICSYDQENDMFEDMNSQ